MPYAAECRCCDAPLTLDQGDFCDACEDLVIAAESTDSWVIELGLSIRRAVVAGAVRDAKFALGEVEQAARDGWPRVRRAAEADHARALDTLAALAGGG